MLLSGPDNMHLGVSLGGQAGGWGVKLRRTSRKPDILYLLMGTPKVADECGDGMLHVQYDMSVPVAVQEVPTIHGVLNTCTTFIMGSVLSLLLDKASPMHNDCTALSPPD